MCGEPALGWMEERGAGQAPDPNGPQGHVPRRLHQRRRVRPDHGRAVRSKPRCGAADHGAWASADDIVTEDDVRPDGGVLLLRHHIACRDDHDPAAAHGHGTWGDGCIHVQEVRGRVNLQARIQPHCDPGHDSLWGVPGDVPHPHGLLQGAGVVQGQPEDGDRPGGVVRGRGGGDQHAPLRYDQDAVPGEHWGGRGAHGVHISEVDLGVSVPGGGSTAALRGRGAAADPAHLRDEPAGGTQG
mmetsp:Transcript_51359/g.164195  ORF Transcript_51359/g.164195 Transcript_51359/m.164195 type:complete len:242 (+) Transcript_51359:276-1001(+)